MFYVPEIVMILVDDQDHLGECRPIEVGRLNMIDYLFDAKMRVNLEGKNPSRNLHWVPCEKGRIVDNISPYDEFTTVRYMGGQPIPPSNECPQCGGHKKATLPYCCARCMQLAEELDVEGMLKGMLRRLYQDRRGQMAPGSKSLGYCVGCGKHIVDASQGDDTCPSCIAGDPRA